ncbi:MAG: XapX domain-containing protein [Pseudomonadota bacterium]
MIEVAAGIGLSLCIRAGCRWFDLPLPAPPRLIVPLLVLVMTAGFVGAEMLL